MYGRFDITRLRGRLFKHRRTNAKRGRRTIRFALHARYTDAGGVAYGLDCAASAARRALLDDVR